MIPVTQNFEIFKNALLYSVTFRVVSTLDHHSEGDIATLTISAFMATSILNSILEPLSAVGSHKNRLVRPIGKVLMFVTQTLISAGIHMQSNLLASYAAGFYRADNDPIYIAISSALGLLLIWVLGVSIGVL